MKQSCLSVFAGRATLPGERAVARGRLPEVMDVFRPQTIEIPDASYWVIEAFTIDGESQLRDVDDGGRRRWSMSASDIDHWIKPGGCDAISKGETFEIAAVWQGQDGHERSRFTCRMRGERVLSVPRSREEACSQIAYTGITMSALLAVGCGFPLAGELEETLLFLRRLRAADREFYDHIAAEIEAYLIEWGIVVPVELTRPLSEPN